jgi:hypothetical protein
MKAPIAAAGVSNLYVQSGLRLRHVAWFALVLGFYDGFFGFVVPILARLVDAFEGRPWTLLSVLPWGHTAPMSG